MQWNSHAYGLGSDDEEDSPYARSSYGHSTSAPRSLSQQLLATAKKWEAEREREASTQKMKLADANASLRSERNRVGTLTAQISTLTSEHAAAKSNFERALSEEKERVREMEMEQEKARIRSAFPETSTASSRPCSCAPCFLNKLNSKHVQALPCKSHVTL